MITPVLTTPIRNGDLIYCATFQLVWNEMVDKIVKEPIILDEEPDYVQQLNRKNFDKSHLDEASYIAMVGYINEGIIPSISASLKERFNETSRINFLSEDPRGIISYAFLKKDVRFPQKYVEIKSTPFMDTVVQGFGTMSSNPAGREQTTVLFYNSPDNFAISIQTKKPSELVVPSNMEDDLILAKVPPQGTLANTIRYVEEQTWNSQERRSGLRLDDQLAIPVVDFDLEHHFKELVGRWYQNRSMAGYFIGDAVQFIKYNLNAEGAQLRSEAAMMSYRCCSTRTRMMRFDEPFLIYMRTNDGKSTQMTKPPYFAAWIATSNLLKSVEQ